MLIGNVELKNNLILAPMAGVTDNVYRDICFSFGAGMTVTEMVSAKGLYYDSANTASLLAPSGTHPEAAQIFGSSPEIMAGQLSSPFFDSFDIIDINMGCPARKIISNNEGSSLMRDLGLAKEIVSACKDATKKPITVKIRAGWDSFVADKFAYGLEQAGACAIAIHGRTTVQGYSGKANLDYIKAVKENVSVPVIANGDITGAASAEKMLTYTKCDALMIGRAAQGRPWIFSEILSGLNKTDFSLSHQQKLNVALEHGTRLAKAKGEYTAMRQMRKHIAWYTHGMPKAAKIRGSMANIKTLEDFYSLIEYLCSLDNGSAIV